MTNWHDLKNVVKKPIGGPIFKGIFSDCSKHFLCYCSMDTDEKKSCSQIFSRFRLCVNELHGILYFTKGEDSSIENRALMTENQKSTHFDKTAPFLQESL